jgi:putative two-component system response regulator
VTTPATGASILVVEDDAQVRGLMRSLVEERGDRCLAAADLTAARQILADEEVELVLCDVELRGESGLDLVRWLQIEHPSVAVVMVTAVDDARFAESALGLGAYGYIIKPFRTNDVLIAIQNALRRRSLELERTADLAQTVGLLANAQEGLRASEEETIHRLGLAAELRDEGTGRHIARVGRSAGLLALQLGLEPDRCELLRLASQLHDLGKIGIPDEILRKTGPLSAVERTVMERHPQIGHRILSESPSPLLQAAAAIALSHHERWDGAGYPFGLAGESIPTDGRIVAVVDVFDALTAVRPYRPAYSPEEAAEMMTGGHGVQFDPEILAVFLDSHEDVLGPQEIAVNL